MTTSLAVPEPGRASALEFVGDHLHHLIDGAVAGSESFAGGQAAADAALRALDVSGYASRRNEVFPASRRGASRLSPYIRHGLLTLGQVWDVVDGAPPRDRAKFRDELLWQEFARHWYAQLGESTARGVRHRQTRWREPVAWDRSMRCLDLVVDELERDGWLVNQTRMWLASDFVVRHSGHWREGEDLFFRHLLDGSRAANRLGWQWTSGLGSAKHYGFSRHQVERRAPGVCDDCVHTDACPIAEWPQSPQWSSATEPPTVRSGDPASFGPLTRIGDVEPTVVWLTAESLGSGDPALVAHPSLPVVFVFDEPLLAGLRLSAKRLVFLVETLAELAETRPVELHLGRPTEVLASRPAAVTFAPVPGFRRRLAQLDGVTAHPWPWLMAPSGRSVRSFSAWRKSVGRM